MPLFLHLFSIPWGAEPRFELGPALQQASALPTKPRGTRNIWIVPVTLNALTYAVGCIGSVRYGTFWINIRNRTNAQYDYN